MASGHRSAGRVGLAGESPARVNAVRTRFRELTDRRRWAEIRDIRDVIAVRDPVLRSWGGDFRTGNASKHFTTLDRFVTSRLVRLIGQCEAGSGVPSMRRTGPTPVSSPSSAFTSSLGRSAIPEACMRREKTIGQPCAGIRTHGWRGGHKKRSARTTAPEVYQ